MDRWPAVASTHRPVGTVQPCGICSPFWAVRRTPATTSSDRRVAGGPFAHTSILPMIPGGGAAHDASLSVAGKELAKEVDPRVLSLMGRDPRPVPRLRNARFSCRAAKSALRATSRPGQVWSGQTDIATAVSTRSSRLPRHSTRSRPAIRSATGPDRPRRDRTRIVSTHGSRNTAA